MTRARPLSDDRGFALVEAVAAAAIFALIVLGVLAGIDGAAGSSGREKARSVAGSLAEQDQERMRGMRAIDLSNYSYARDVVVAGATYRVASDSDWIRDNTGGTISCTNSSTQADYLRIRSTVTSSTVGSRTAPVTIDSLVAPPVGAVGANQGTLAVQINNRDGVGVPNIAVTIGNGTQTKGELTNELGCAIFAYIPVGTWDVNVNNPGWVNPLGVQDVHMSGNVSNGTTNVTTILYDVAGSVNATVRSRYFNNTSATGGTMVTGASRAFDLGFANAGIPGTGMRVFPETTPLTVPSGAFTATKLFPFKDAYGIFTGQCSAENPGTNGAKQIVDRAGIYNVNVTQPGPRVVVKAGTAVVGAANVTATLSASAACAPNDVMAGVRTDTVNGLTTWNVDDFNKGFLTRKGATFDPGLPYGTWDICADNVTRRKTVTGVANTAMTTTPALVTIDVNSTGSTTGRCP